MYSRPTAPVRRLALLATFVALGVAVTGCGGSGATPGSGIPGASGSEGMGSAPASSAPAATTPPSAVTTAAPSPTGGGSAVLPAGWTLCQNVLRGSSMAYPGGWFTTELRPADRCSQFHPEAFTIPAAGEFPLTALNAVQTEESLAQYMAQATDPAFVTVTRRTSTTVLGLPAERFETISLGEGLDELGTRVYGYAINRGGKAFVVWTVARAGETRYASWKTIVDQAVTTLRFLA